MALTKDEAHAIVAPLYEALNEPAKKNVRNLLAQAANPDYRSCSTLTDCLDREGLAQVFEWMGAVIPNLGWKIKELWVTTDDRIVVLGEATGTPTGTFWELEPTGRSFRTISLDIFTVKNGKLSSAYHVENWAGALAQLRGELSESLQERNKALLIKGFKTLFNDRNFAEAEKLWSPNYIQHSGHIPPGREGLFGLVKAFPPDTKWDHGIVMAEGDFVMIHSRYSNGDGSALIVVDIMRIKDGIFMEHWDVTEGSATEAESRSKRPMFGDSWPKLSFKESPVGSAW